ncbi:hypothetical protein AVEN_96894-1 [Araneus ventricosus]|uniref:FLYWCH-type domain-containing protein n=1 Tax=Araneus ventricosus TaxID=182803 RepID=A0A4Y2FZK4_ARAVE|nr:hypothetical protein AVEN_96894-1 [Araneus ventricosus]
MEFMLNEKGRRLLVHDNYKFYKQHNTQEGLKWGCVGRKCLAKIYMDENATVMLKTDHERDTNLERQDISKSYGRATQASAKISSKGNKQCAFGICRKIQCRRY